MMNHRKIILIALNAKYVHSNLAVYDLEAYCKRRWEVAETSRDYALKEKIDQCAFYEIAGHLQICVREFTINHNLDYILQELYREKADVYAFSCYIWNIYEVLSVARELKKLLKHTEIWLGGPEVSYDAKKNLEKNPFVTGIMVGEGEVTFYELTKLWNDIWQQDDAGKSLEYKDILGIVYRERDGKIMETGKRPLMNLDDLPFVYEDLEKFQNKILYYETSRGCPFSCSYCLSSIEKQVRFRSFSIVKEELQFFLDHKVPQVKFVDRTFNCNKKHALEIWNYILEHDNGVTNFHFEIAADLIGEDELLLFKKMRPGLIQLEIGLQSTNPKTIKEIRRVMDVEQVKKILLKIRSYGNIHQHLDLIAGLPYEDMDSFQKSFHDAYEMRPNQLQLGFLKVLKGSYMEEQTGNYELEYSEAQPYEVLSTKWLSYDDILVLKQVEEMVEVYYNSNQFEHTLPFLISFFPNAYAFYEALGNYYKKNDLFGIGFKREARYQALREFFSDYFVTLQERKMLEIFKKHGPVHENITDVMKTFDSLLTFDFYLRENAKKRPAWAEKEPIEKEIYHAFFKHGGNAEASLFHEGYDSKAAARDMHIEPVMKEAYLWIIYGCEMMEEQIPATNSRDRNTTYCLFDYQNRNPLTKDAKVIFLSTLHSLD